MLSVRVSTEWLNGSVRIRLWVPVWFQDLTQLGIEMSPDCKRLMPDPCISILSNILLFLLLVYYY
jgi:hypothetical protein